MTTNVRGSFSAISGTDVRIVYTDTGSILGTVKKLPEKGGYKVVRRDGKIRIKPTLAAAYRSIKRAN